MVRMLRQRPKLPTLKVRARLGHQRNPEDPGPRVTDHAKMASGYRAFVGCIFNRELAIPGESEGAWHPTVEPQEIPASGEYLQALAHGDLWPADEATAEAANRLAAPQGLPPVKFDPTYAGELAELTDWLRDLDAEKKGNAPPLPAPVSVPAPVPGLVTISSPSISVSERVTVPNIDITATHTAIDEGKV